MPSAGRTRPALVVLALVGAAVLLWEPSPTAAAAVRRSRAARAVVRGDGAALQPSDGKQAQAQAAQNPQNAAAPAPANVAGATGESTESVIIKSLNDVRSYRRFALHNGLDCLVISDPKTTKAAAAMDVSVGYWQDPDDIPGLAHFLEHMLFLGTQKYPEEDSYTEYLSSHGGSSNAFTAMENTNFYFDVQPEALDGTLDRFAQFFVAPTFTAGSTGRERNAVDSEHRKNLQSDSWRIFQIIQSVSNSSHPFHKFGTGNSQTLGSVPSDQLRAALLAFWKLHYVAPNMRLAVLGRDSLDNLEQSVRALFADVPTAGGKAAEGVSPVPFRVVDMHDSIFSHSHSARLLEVNSVKDNEGLQLVWALPPQTLEYASKSLDYIDQLLGHEGSGSLLSFLRRNGWANALSAGPDVSTSNFDLYQVEIDLTEEGMREEVRHKIISKVFEYIRLIEERGVEEWRWREMGTISAIDFRFKNKEAAQSYVSDLVQDMDKYRPRDLLIADFVYDVYKPELVRKLLGMLQPETMVVVVSDQNLVSGNLKTEPWYGTQYREGTVGRELMDEWREARNIAVDKLEENHELSLPTKNSFIPSDLTLLEADEHAKEDFPRIIRDVVDGENGQAGSVRLWFKQDVSFQRPIANLVCKFWSSAMYASPRDVVLSSLYVKLVKDALRESTYLASVVGYNYEYSSDVDGADLHISGYSSMLRDFSQRVAEHLMMKWHDAPVGALGFTPLNTRFEVMRDELNQSYSNFVYGQPHIHSGYGMSLLLEQPHFHISQYVKAVHDVTLYDVVAWSREFFQDVGLECLVHGNLREAQALDILSAITNSLYFRSNEFALRSVSSQVQRIVQLDGDYTFTLRTPNRNDENSAVYAYYQVGEAGNVMEDVLTDLLSMVMEKPAFHQLRTVEQLGYIVWSGTDVREGVNGIRVIVQSPTYDAQYLDGRVRAFMELLGGIVGSMGDTEFSTFRSTLESLKRQRPRTLSEKTSRYWGEVASQQYMFERRALEIEVLKQLELSDFKAFFVRLVGGSVEGKGIANRISVQVNSQLPPRNASSNGSTGGSGEEDVKGAPVSRPEAPVPKLAPPAAPSASFVQVDTLHCPGEDSRCSCVDDPSSSDCRGWTVVSSASTPVVNEAKVTVIKPVTVSVASPQTSPPPPLPPLLPPCSCEHEASEPCGCKNQGGFTDYTCGSNGPRKVHAPLSLTSRMVNAFKGHLCLYPVQPVGTVEPWSPSGPSPHPTASA